jgi:hypothetical protein
MATKTIARHTHNGNDVNVRKITAPIVNGRTVNVATRLQQRDPQNPGQFIPLTRWKIAIEIEYAEIWFRRIEVKAI